MLNIVIVNIDNQLKVVVTIILSKDSTPVTFKIGMYIINFRILDRFVKSLLIKDQCNKFLYELFRYIHVRF